MRKASRMRLENLAIPAAIAIPQTEPNKISLAALLISGSHGRTVAEVAQAAEIPDFWQTSADIATTGRGFGSS